MLNKEIFLNNIDNESYLVYNNNMKYAEYDIRKAARFLNIKPKELKEIKNENMFLAMVLGAVILDNGVDFGEALFRLRDKNEVNRYMDRVTELEAELSKAQKEIIAVSLAERISS